MKLLVNMIFDWIILSVKRVVILVLFALLPILWLFVAGRMDILSSGNVSGAVSSLWQLSIKDLLLATGTTVTCGSCLYHYLDLNLFLLRLPLLGYIDRLFAKVLALVGVSLVVLAYKW